MSENRKIRHTLESIQEFIVNHDATPLFNSYKGTLDSLELKCHGCGKAFSINLQAIQRFLRRNPNSSIRCTPCNMASMGRRNSTINTPEFNQKLKDFFTSKGLTPLFDTYPCKNTIPLEFVCTCGRIGTIIYDQIQKSNWSVTPRCTSCNKTFMASPRK